MINELNIIFIDRDGVINVDPIGDYVKSWKDFRFEKNVLEALKAITDLGFEIIIISNQAGIGDGVFSLEALNDIQRQMLTVFEEKGIRVRSSHYCLHGKKEGCACRKPATGLFEKAVEGLAYDPSKTFFVGDKATDMEAGKRFGLKTIFVRTGHGKMDESKLTGTLKPDHTVNGLADVLGILSA